METEDVGFGERFSFSNGDRVGGGGLCQLPICESKKEVCAILL